MWPPCRPHLEINDDDYEQEQEIEPQPVRHRKSALRRANPFIEAKAGVDGYATGDEGTDDENDDLEGFIIANDVEY